MCGTFVDGDDDDIRNRVIAAKAMAMGARAIVMRLFAGMFAEAGAVMNLTLEMLGVRNVALGRLAEMTGAAVERQRPSASATPS